MKQKEFEFDEKIALKISLSASKPQTLTQIDENRMLMLGQVLQQRLVRGMVVGEIGYIHRCRVERVLIGQEHPHLAPFRSWYAIFDCLVEHLRILSGLDRLDRLSAKEIVPNFRGLSITAGNLIVLQFDALDLVGLDCILPGLQAGILLVHPVEDYGLLDGHAPQFSKLFTSSLSIAELGSSQWGHVLISGYFHVLRWRNNTV